MERFSYRTVTVIVLLMLAMLGIIHTLLAKQQFHDAALRSQAANISRVIEVASDDALKTLHNDTLKFATSVRPHFFDSRAKRLYDTKVINARLGNLPAMMINGSSHLAVIKVRIYDKKLNLLAEGGKGAFDLKQPTPRFIQERAMSRQDLEGSRGTGKLWQSTSRPLYSVFLPLGDSNPDGYMEVVSDPLASLSKISSMIKMPIRISATGNKTLYTSSSFSKEHKSAFVPVEYLLRDDYDRPLYSITAYVDTQSFQSDLSITQFSYLITFVIITIAILLLAHHILNRLFFQPVSRLVDGLQKCMDGNLDTPIDEHGVKEVHMIAHAFNTLAQTLRTHMDELQRLSSLDGLTGIANRRIFDHQMEQEWTRALRNRTSLAMMIIDIDYFKAFNDTQGHQAGDDCLREVAATLQKVMKRPGDMLARYGGEEFAIILPDTDIFGASIVALNLSKALEARAIPHPGSAVSPMVTLSIGINVVIPASSETIKNFIEGADRALYEVKRKGRNSIGFANGIDAEIYRISNTPISQNISAVHQ